MPPNRTVFCPFLPTSRPRLRRSGRTFRTEETVEKATIRPEVSADRAKPREALDRRYGKIGISAVAATVRYQGDARTAPPAQDEDRDAADKAA